VDIKRSLYNLSLELLVNIAKTVLTIVTKIASEKLWKSGSIWWSCETVA